MMSGASVENNIGADYTSQTLIDFDWYNPHIYHVPQEKI